MTKSPVQSRHDYMMESKPILYTISDDNNPIEKSQNSICCEVQNIEQVSNAMNEFSKMSDDQLDRMGQKGKELLSKNKLV